MSNISPTLKIQWNSRLKLVAESSKLRAEGRKLVAEGNTSFLSAVIETFGNIFLTWSKRDEGEDCLLENGELYAWDTPIEL